MVSSDQRWIALGVVVAAKYVAGLAFWVTYATQGAAFAALSVAVVLGSLLWLGELLFSGKDRCIGLMRDLTD